MCMWGHIRHIAHASAPCSAHGSALSCLSYRVSFMCRVHVCVCDADKDPTVMRKRPPHPLSFILVVKKEGGSVRRGVCSFALALCLEDGAWGAWRLIGSCLAVAFGELVKPDKGGIADAASIETSLG